MPDSLQTFVAGVRAAWGPLSTATVTACRGLLADLARASADEPWLADPADAELDRDPAAGYVLLTHTESRGLYRVPHDHGRGWVIYAVHSGEIEMRTYGRIATPDGVRLVLRDATRMRAGDCAVYLPGDIHDTRCVSDRVRMLRFTSCDLRAEDRAGTLTRYLERDGAWTVA